MTRPIDPRRRARQLLLIFVGVLLAVVSIAWLSIDAGKGVRQQAETLARQRIPELGEIRALQAVVAARVEQLYLSYARGERLVTQPHYNEYAERVHLHVDALTRLGLNQMKRVQLLDLVRAFDWHAHEFDLEMMRGDQRSWDTLREHLAAAQASIDGINAMLLMWSDELGKSADNDGVLALAGVARLTALQIGFSGAVLVVAAFVLIALYARLKDQDELYRRAYFDDVSGLPNRRSLEKTLANRLARSGGGSLQILRLTRLQRVASTYGHGTADQLIQGTVQRLADGLQAQRLEGELFRLNSDSLAVIGPPGGVEAAKKLAGALAVLAEETVTVAGRDLRIGLAIGIALFPEDSSDVACLIRDADAALQGANGDSPVRFFDRQITAESEQWLRLEGQLRTALKQSEFELHYQPKVRAVGQQTYGSEALIRWRQDGKLVSPGVFIPVAEESGLIVPIGTWVLMAACRQWREWADAGLPPLPIAVNVSAQQFQDEAFPDLVAEALQRHAIPEGMIELEITEAVAADDPERVIATMSALKRAGVSLAIDDFGTGYSSLAYLKRFPIDTLKIDQAFVRAMTHSTEDAAIVRMILGLAASLRLKVVAEGVETEAQQHGLAAENCDLLQGYLFSKPLPAGEFARWLHAEKAIPELTSPT